MDKMNKVAVITGAGGVLCGIIAGELAAIGYKTALLDINENAVGELAEKLRGKGFAAKGYGADVLNKTSLFEACEKIRADFGVCELLINGAGGNNQAATTDAEFYRPKRGIEACSEIKERTFFDLTESGVDFVFNLNFKGTFLTTQIFAKDMAERGSGNIINISSMNAFTPLTKIPAYSAAKAAVSNFTEWLAVHFAPVGIRVNAIAPGFFITNQNRNLLFDGAGNPTARSQKILRNTPMNRFGDPKELLGAIRFFADDENSGFVTGVVLPIDGGFNAYSGV
jgi:NAD(P)-dependent dehydrogenase (short-subunit alcohol dehydrogenase family)